MKTLFSSLQAPEKVDPFELLSRLQGQSRWAWITEEETLIAWGQTATLQAPDQAGLQEQLQILQRTHDLPEETRLFGSLPFDPARASDSLWAGFHSPILTLPQVIYRQMPHHQQLIRLANSPARQEQVSQPGVIPPATWKEDTTFDEWKNLLHTARQHMQNGGMKKVVLARTRSLAFAKTPDLTLAFAALVKKYPHTFRFYFEPVPGSVFMGATPELLAKTQGNALETVALAGSARRGSTPEEDQQIGIRLLQSAKDRREQEIVLETICNHISPLGAELTYPSTPGLRRLPNIQHLETTITARLHRTGVLPAVSALHPTPALAGEPRTRALDFIRRHEPHERGGYGAPVGWVKPNGDGLFAVAIRSAVFHQQHGRLYAGAGILPDSDPEKEWQETALKFRPIMDALGITEAA